MKLKKYIVIGIMSLIALSCVGCQPKYYTDEYKEVVEKENKEKADKWFLENKPELVGTEFETYVTNMDLYNLVTGTFVKDSQEIKFFLNVDTGEFYTSENYEMVREYFEKRMAEELGYPAEDTFVNEYFYIPMPCTSLRVDTKEDEPKYYSVETRENVFCVKEDLSEKDLDSLYQLLLDDEEQPYIYYSILVDSYDDIKEQFGDFEIFKKHPNLRKVEFSLRNPAEDQTTYYLYNESSCYELVKSWTDKDGEYQYKVIKKKNKHLFNFFD